MYALPSMPACPQSAVPSPLTNTSPTDAQLLLWFKGNFTNGVEGLPDWQPGTDPCDGWAGVVCTAGHVTEL